jgi:hypothetical protein
MVYVSWTLFLFWKYWIFELRVQKKKLARHLLYHLSHACSSFPLLIFGILSYVFALAGRDEILLFTLPAWLG